MKDDNNNLIHSDSVKYLEGLLTNPSGHAIFKKEKIAAAETHPQTFHYFGKNSYIELPNDWQKEDIFLILNAQATKKSMQEAFQTLVSVEFFENFLHTKYVGQKRFSIEGCDTAIVLLNELIHKSQTNNLREIVLGMSHRGRINALYHVLHKPLEKIIQEFEGIEEIGHISGDVKYHKGYTRICQGISGPMKIQLLDNPSHLESVYPVVEGHARGLIDSGLPSNLVLPIVFHGDAAFAGQGVVYETMQLSRLPPYTVNGSIHVVINNQIGFTATPQELQSVESCTDIAHTFQIPILHVPAEDIEGILAACEAAYFIRQSLQRDVIIELIGVRKWGHNESDEPSFTSPALYKTIREKSHFRNSVAESLINSEHIPETFLAQEETKLKEIFTHAYDRVKKDHELSHHISTQIEELKPVDTSIKPSDLKNFLQDLFMIPKGYSLHGSVLKQIDHRRKMLETQGLDMEMDWGVAELLAFSSLCREGVSVRLIGQDTQRGTFSHRHAIWVDQSTEQVHYPVQQGLSDPSLFQVWNSPLSENAAMAFEYGYSLARPDALVIWEAQFGDFANGAQIVIDQYLSSSEQKWGRPSRLVLLLPHGYEGQGPEHSSCRLERFLQLSGQNNWIIAQPSTPLQYLMLLRRHMSKISPIKPLIIATPKSLLRNPQCVSKAIEATTTEFQPLLSDNKFEAESLILCSGKVYYDYVQEVSKEFGKSVSFLRIEQLYPFPLEEVKQVLGQLKNLKNCIWLQEEPENMGANWYMHELLEPIIPSSCSFYRICRPKSATPAVGFHSLHSEENTQIKQTLYSILKVS